MPAGQPQNAFDPQRFAALWAGFDTGNTSDAEAKGKAQELRRMAVAEKVRIIDLMGRLDVMRALDAQLRPVRETPDTAPLDAAQAEAPEPRAQPGPRLPKV